MGKLIGFLRESDLFFNLSNSQLELIENFSEELTYQDKDMIFVENSRENELYLILHGEIEILVNPGLVAPRGELVKPEEIIAVLGRGQSFGEIALVDAGVRTASARAGQKGTRLIRIPRDNLILLCKTNPELGYQVMFNLSVALSNKIRNADLKIREVLLYQSYRTELPGQ